MKELVSKSMQRMWMKGVNEGNGRCGKIFFIKVNGERNNKCRSLLLVSILVSFFFFFTLFLIMIHDGETLFTLFMQFV